MNWDEARLLANHMSLTSFRDDAIEGGILSRAGDGNAAGAGNFIRMLTGHPVEIVFQAAETPVIPTSRQPEVPWVDAYSPEQPVAKVVWLRVG